MYTYIHIYIYIIKYIYVNIYICTYILSKTGREPFTPLIPDQNPNTEGCVDGVDKMDDP